MRFARFAGYFTRVRELLGTGAAVRFAVGYARAKMMPPRDGALGRISIGPYAFYFPSIDYFAGLFAEIFLQETYYLGKTDAPLRIIDAGANIGMSLVYLKLRAPNTRITCFEPNPAARVVLERNIEANGWRESVRVFPYALGDRNASVRFSVERKEATSSGGRVALSSEDSSYEVDQRRLSDFIESDIDLLKMDIEGGEFAVLSDLSSGPLSRIRAIQLEYHYMPGYQERPLSELLGILESSGFRTFVDPTSAPHAVVDKDVVHAYMVFAWRP